MKALWKVSPVLIILAVSLITAYVVRAQQSSHPNVSLDTFDHTVNTNAKRLIADGRQIFRFDTFGDEDFWGGTLQLHKAIEGAKFGGVGPGVSPATAAAVGLKIDVDALPPSIVSAIKAGQVNLNDPAITLALLKLNAVVGVTGIFNSEAHCNRWVSSVPSATRVSTIRLAPPACRKA